MPKSVEPVERFDDPKPFFKGERWVDLGVAIGSWLATRKNPSLAIRTLGTFVAATLVARAAHGHKALSNTMRWTPIGGGIKRS